MRLYLNEKEVPVLIQALENYAISELRDKDIIQGLVKRIIECERLQCTQDKRK